MNASPQQGLAAKRELPRGQIGRFARKKDASLQKLNLRAKPVYFENGAGACLSGGMLPVQFLLIALILLRCGAGNKRRQVPLTPWQFPPRKISSEDEVKFSLWCRQPAGSLCRSCGLAIRHENSQRSIRLTGESRHTVGHVMTPQRVFDEEQTPVRLGCLERDGPECVTGNIGGQGKTAGALAGQWRA